MENDTGVYGDSSVHHAFPLPSASRPPIDVPGKRTFRVRSYRNDPTAVGSPYNQQQGPYGATYRAEIGAPLVSDSLTTASAKKPATTRKRASRPQPVQSPPPAQAAQATRSYYRHDYDKTRKSAPASVSRMKATASSPASVLHEPPEAATSSHYRHRWTHYPDVCHPSSHAASHASSQPPAAPLAIPQHHDTRFVCSHAGKDIRTQHHYASSSYPSPPHHSHPEGHHYPQLSDPVSYPQPSSAHARPHGPPHDPSYDHRREQREDRSERRRKRHKSPSHHHSRSHHSSSPAQVTRTTPSHTDTPTPHVRVCRVLTLLIEDKRSPDAEALLAEIRVPLKPAEGGDVGFWADAAEVANELQNGPSRIDGESMVPCNAFVILIVHQEGRRCTHYVENSSSTS